MRLNAPDLVAGGSGFTQKYPDFSAFLCRKQEAIPHKKSR